MRTKLGGQDGFVARMNHINSGEDPNVDSDLIILSDPSPLRDMAKMIFSTISQMVLHGFGRNLVDRMGL